MKRSQFIEEDSAAQENEHSVEVQIPMLQFLYNKSIRIVPIVIMIQNLEVCKDLSIAIGEVVRKRNAVIIASSDFTHYEPATIAREKDERVMGSIKQLRGEDVLRTVERYDITMCGPAPVATTLLAASLLGAQTSQILKYATSGDITGDMNSVVGSAAAKIALG